MSETPPWATQQPNKNVLLDPEKMGSGGGLLEISQPLSFNKDILSFRGQEAWLALGRVLGIARSREPLYLSRATTGQ